MKPLPIPKKKPLFLVESTKIMRPINVHKDNVEDVFNEYGKDGWFLVGNFTLAEAKGVVQTLPPSIFTLVAFLQRFMKND